MELENNKVILKFGHLVAMQDTDWLLSYLEGNDGTSISALLKEAKSRIYGG